jgi:ribonucleoside-triphosphate reductase
MRDIPAIGPGGKYTGRPYGSYEKTAQAFCRAMLEVWREGDRDGHLFAFPKCDFHINAEAFADPAQRALVEHACVLASENGVPYFVFDRDEVTLSACCRLRTAIDDKYMVEHPESMRFCGFQNVTINLPQAAYRAGPGNWDGLMKEIGTGMDLAMKAHLQKREFIRKMMSSPAMPLWQIGQTARDGRPYVDLDKCTYIIGLIGLNECIQYMTGKELHETDEALRQGLVVVAAMHHRAKQYTREHGLKVSLEESPAESATRRFAKVDCRDWPQARSFVKGDLAADEAYYTNSIHLRADAQIDLLTRIQKQAKFHTMIESGAIIHAFVGEERPPAESIFTLVRRTFEKTKAAQITISPEFTICNHCRKCTPRLQDYCDFCKSTDVYGMTRIVGYFSRVSNWNKSKLGELKDRHRGNYSVVGVVPQTAVPEVGTAAG